MKNAVLLILISLVTVSCFEAAFPYECEVNLIVYPYDDAVSSVENLTYTKHLFSPGGHLIDHNISSKNDVIEIELIGIIYPAGDATAAMTPARSMINLSEYLINDSYALKICSNNQTNEARIEVTDSTCILIPVKNRNVDFETDMLFIQTQSS
ncbi:MAG: hypothetical protein J7M01_04870 [Candidatus Marinimicrobia bacterium]|nr:hypothetical protein [Candidatus Neomarinimicrobiota bacterium]